MGFAFWKKKGSEPRVEQAAEDRRARAPEGGGERLGCAWSRLRRIAVGAAVLLSAFVIAAPFFVSERAIEAETAAKTEIPAEPAAAEASAPLESAASAQAAESGASSASSAPNDVPAAPSADVAPIGQPITSKSEAEAQKAQADAAAASRAAAIAADNQKAKAAIEKKAAEGRKAADDQLALAIKSEARKGPEKKPADKAGRKEEGKEAASGAWVVPVGAFSDAGVASRIAATARGNGVPVSVSQVKTAKGALSRITAGPFKSREQAEAAEGRLAMAGIKAGAPRQAK